MIRGAARVENAAVVIACTRGTDVLQTDVCAACVTDEVISQYFVKMRRKSFKSGKSVTYKNALVLNQALIDH